MSKRQRMVERQNMAKGHTNAMRHIWMSLGIVLLLGVVPARGGEIDGTGTADKLVGQDGVDDVIKARGGNDVIVMRGTFDHDQIYCGSGTDTIDLSQLKLSNAWLHVDLDAGRMEGSMLAACENIIGTDRPEEDVLSGDGHRNRLDGGLGGDWLTGRGGADAFVYRRWKDSPATHGKPDVIRDFSVEENDVIDLSAFAPKGGSLTYIGGERKSFTGKAGEFRSRKLSTLTFELLGDRNGDKKSDMRIGVVFRKPTGAFPVHSLKLK